ncbi:GTPase HflX [Desulfoscipio gibsoniae]|uniref:GTPase HflX n=1 Tax=Desulfoscipio gibsoniae DSM 7213 TaxID=767817 RepID=R4KTF9_9FIRM|nr:GTPase HflX [Desulfoscipio gibsoniae]AGL03890.1 GTP-binding protein HflX [Desulfoscipio gibsoniae DSM 7213]
MTKTVYGNTRGLKKVDLDLLQGIYELAIDKNMIISLEIAQIMAVISSSNQRELVVFMDRQGRVASVGVGDAATVQLKAQSRRRGEHRLAGLRCIHTHPSGSGQLSAVDYAALYDMRLDVMVALGVQDGKIKEACLACLEPRDGQLTQNFQNFGPMSFAQLAAFPLTALIQDIEDSIKPPAAVSTSKTRQIEKAILVTIAGEDTLDELALLADTAGATPVARVTQHRKKPDTAFFIGRGKVEELALHRQSLGAELVIFDDELTPTQARNLEHAIGCRIVDRTTLILDIFAQRARTKEGKLQVELAQLRYLLPRLTGLGTALSRLGGGIGTRGPGETKLETDRRHIRRRIDELTNALEQVRRHRQQQRQNRRESASPVVALVGYTNAGKSTLLNALTQAQVYTANQLFATLDTTTRRLQLPGNREVLLTDTVGFIRKLPHHLVKAFRATLEEVIEADLLLHVVDASHAGLAEQIAAVEAVLKELGVQDKHTILVFNKIDQPVNHQLLEQVKLSYHCQFVEVSAHTGTGLEQLKELIAQNTLHQQRLLKGRLPYDRTDLVALLHQHGKVYSEKYGPEGIQVEAAVDECYWAALAPYLKT